jgi:hypothetical protein
VTFAIAPSRLLRKPVARTEAPRNWRQHAALDAGQRLGLEQRIRIGDLIADREAAMSSFERRRAVGVIGEAWIWNVPLRTDTAARGLR